MRFSSKINNTILSPCKETLEDRLEPTVLRAQNRQKRAFEARTRF